MVFNNITENISNLTLQLPPGIYRQEFEYVTYKAHAIDPVDIAIVVAGYIILSYVWVKINKDKEKYQKWVNPQGRVVNLYKIIKILMIVYPITVVILGALQIILTILST